MLLQLLEVYSASNKQKPTQAHVNRMGFFYAIPIPSHPSHMIGPHKPNMEANTSHPHPSPSHPNIPCKCRSPFTHTIPCPSIMPIMSHSHPMDPDGSRWILIREHLLHPHPSSDMPGIPHDESICIYNTPPIIDSPGG